MDAHPLSSPEEARASLDEVERSRRAAVQATQRPVWLVAALAAVVGLYVGLLNLGGTTAKLMGLIIFIVGFFGLTVVGGRLARFRGQIFDNRSVGAAALRLIPAGIALGALVVMEPSPAWQPWYSIGLGLATAVGGFAYGRWADNYRARRLAAGDYDPANLR